MQTKNSNKLYIPCYPYKAFKTHGMINEQYVIFPGMLLLTFRAILHNPQVAGQLNCLPTQPGLSPSVQRLNDLHIVCPVSKKLDIGSSSMP